MLTLGAHHINFHILSYRFMVISIVFVPGIVILGLMLTFDGFGLEIIWPNHLLMLLLLYDMILNF